MAPDAKIRASGLKRLLLVPVRARGHITEKLGASWATAADAIIVGGALGLFLALALDVPGEARLGIFAGSVVLAAIAGVMIGTRRKPRPNRQDDIQP